MSEVVESEFEPVLDTKPQFREVKVWLQKYNCSQYYTKFVDNGITWDLVRELDSKALIELSVTKIGDRLKLERAIAALKANDLCGDISMDTLKQMFGHYLQDLNQDSVSPDGTNSLTLSSDLKMPSTSQSTSNHNDSKSVTFILQDGSIKKVNVTGCFNAQSIKRKVLRKLGFRSQDPPYDAYIHNSDEQVILLYDVELVTICYSPGRLEKHRIMFVPQGEFPSEYSIETSKKIMKRSMKSLRSKSRPKDTNDSSKRNDPAFRNFFGQRPPSELISSNLAEYFPETKQQDLEATVRNSVRYSVRLSKRINFPPGSISSAESLIPSSKRLSISTIQTGASRLTQESRRVPSRTVGDVMVRSIAAIDGVFNQSDNHSLLSVPSARSRESKETTMKNNLDSVCEQGDGSKTFTQPKILVTASFADNSSGNRNSRIELLSVDSDSDDDFFGDYYNEDTNSLELSMDEGPKHWLRGARIGAGSFGTVYLGMNPITGELMAVKQIPLPSQNKGSDIQKAMQEQQREMMLLKQLNHENIVRYYGSRTDENSVSIFLEYVPGGSVQSMLQSYGPFEEPLIRNFIRQVLIGLSYLHGEDIIHRDIKGANILIDIKGTVKIGDFGISRKVNQGDQNEKKSARRASLQGSVYWMAPEVVKQTVYTKKADIWSVGCLIIEMFTGKHPFPEFSQMQALFKIGTHVSPQIPEWCTNEGKEFLSKTFEINYDQRPDAIDLLSAPFLTPLIMSKK
jgi:mitogen-activated protein kinase kinase kinase